MDHDTNETRADNDYDLVRDETGKRLYLVNAEESAKWKAGDGHKS
ncbi:hypothetical protein PQQ51_33970 [Paraburkholderia xenovorans]